MNIPWKEPDLEKDVNDISLMRIKDMLVLFGKRWWQIPHVKRKGYAVQENMR